MAAAPEVPRLKPQRTSMRSAAGSYAARASWRAPGRLPEGESCTHVGVAPSVSAQVWSVSAPPESNPPNMTSRRRTGSETMQKLLRAAGLLGNDVTVQWGPPVSGKDHRAPWLLELTTTRRLPGPS